MTESKPIKGDNSVWVQRLQETVPSHLFSRLKKYQIEGIAQALAWNGRVLIGMVEGRVMLMETFTFARRVTFRMHLLQALTATFVLCGLTKRTRWGWARRCRHSR